MLIAFVAHMEFKLYQIDITSVFLNRHFQEEVYVKQPPGFENHEHPTFVYILDKALYGLKKAPCVLYDRLSRFLLSHGYSRKRIDNTLFLRKKGAHVLKVQVCVDDIIFGGTDEALGADFAKLMGSEFEMSMMGELNFFLGLQIIQTLADIFIHQQKYIKELLEKFGMLNTKPSDTPMATTTKLDRDERGINIGATKYSGMIGSLLYLTASKPDIVFSVGVCARFQATPKKSHLQAVKQILRYLKGTMDQVLWYPTGSSFDLIRFADADYVGYLIDRKSTSRMAHFLGLCLVSCATKKQNSVALSTVDAEYAAIASSCAQLL